MKIDQNQILYFHNCINVLQVCVQHKLEKQNRTCQLQTRSVHRRADSLVLGLVTQDQSQ